MKTRLSLLALAAAAALAGCTKDPVALTTEAPPAEAVAVVNGEAISKDAFEMILNQVSRGQPQMVGPEDRDALREELIKMTLLAQDAKRQGLDKEPEVQEQMRQVQAQLQQLNNRILAQAALERMMEAGADEALLQAEYDKRFGQAQTEYRARHILVDSKEKAEELIKEIQGGADFAKLAEENSTDTGSAANGGDLDWFMPEQMVPSFSEAVKSLEPGAVTSEPVQSQYGWHVIKLEDSRPAQGPSLEEVKPQLEQMVLQQQLEARLEKLRAEGKVELMPLDASGAEAPAQEAPATEAPAQDSPEADQSAADSE